MTQRVSRLVYLRHPEAVRYSETSVNFDLIRQRRIAEYFTSFAALN
jgi:hypothetical protein